MKDPRKDKSLEDRIYTIKEKLYKPLLALTTTSLLGLATYSPLAKAQEARRIIEVEAFDGSISRSNIKDAAIYDFDMHGYREIDSTPYWTLDSEYLLAQDITNQGESFSGYLRTHFNNNTFDFKSNNGCIIVTFDKTNWGAGDFYGLVIGGDPTPEENAQGTYYEFAIRANPEENGPGQFAIYYVSPGLTHAFALGTTDAVVKGSANTLAAIYNSLAERIDSQGRTLEPGWNFYINDMKVHGDVGIPPLNGYVGVTGFDSRFGSDDNNLGTARFNNFTFEYDQIQGGGAGLQDLTQPDIPKLFIRADSNMDGEVNISDGINTLNHLFLGGGNSQCLDAMDFDDNGALDLTDAVKIFNKLFLGDSTLIPPPNLRQLSNGNLASYAQYGIDITYDNVPCNEGYDEQTRALIDARYQ